MKVGITRKILPYLLFYTDDLPKSIGGRANGPVVRIRPRYRNDAGLHRHEEEHVWQWYITLGIHGLLYKFWRRYRCWSEAQAFGTQMGPGVSLAKLAERMAGSHYDLGITSDEARRLIVRASRRRR